MLYESAWWSRGWAVIERRTAYLQAWLQDIQHKVTNQYMKLSQDQTRKDHRFDTEIFKWSLRLFSRICWFRSTFSFDEQTSDHWLSLWNRPAFLIVIRLRVSSDLQNVVFILIILHEHCFFNHRSSMSAAFLLTMTDIGSFDLRRTWSSEWRRKREESASMNYEVSQIFMLIFNQFPGGKTRHRIRTIYTIKTAEILWEYGRKTPTKFTVEYGTNTAVYGQISVENDRLLWRYSDLRRPVIFLRGCGWLIESVYPFVSWRRDEQHPMWERPCTWRTTLRFSLFELIEEECPWCCPRSSDLQTPSFRRMCKSLASGRATSSPIVERRNWTKETNRSKWRMQTLRALTKRWTSIAVQWCHGLSRWSWRLCRLRWRILGRCRQLLNKRACRNRM